jgi:hypothetical protein
LIAWKKRGTSNGALHKSNQVIEAVMHSISDKRYYPIACKAHKGPIEDIWSAAATKETQSDNRPTSQQRCCMEFFVACVQERSTEKLVNLKAQ